MSNYEAAINFLDKKVGINWLNKLSKEEIMNFVYWANNTGVYRFDEDKSRHGSNGTEDAFRGYCMGIITAKQNTKDVGLNK